MASRILTTQELLMAPTGIDWNSVAESFGVASPAQAVEQAFLLDSASSMVGNWMGMTQGVHAITRTETKRCARANYYGSKAFVDQNGWLNLYMDTMPVLSVSSLSYAISPSPLTYVAVTPLNPNIEGAYPQIFRVSDNSRDWTWAKFGGVYFQTTYISGWGNATLLSAVSAGSNVTLNIDDTTGMASTGGTTNLQNILRIYDGALTEDVTISSVTDATHIVVPTLAFPHDPAKATVGVSAIPADIKWACVLAVIHLARERGITAIVMSTSRSVTGRPNGEGADAEAMAILEEYTKRVV